MALETKDKKQKFIDYEGVEQGIERSGFRIDMLAPPRGFVQCSYADLELERRL
jgi:hypothetical protein